MSESNKHNDNELAAYLDGRDGVSSAYRATGGDEPPAALDRAILQAARDVRPAVKQRTRRFNMATLYPLAASVMVAGLLIAMFPTRQDLPQPEQDITIRSIGLKRSAQPANQVEAPAAAPALPKADTAAAPLEASPRADFVQRQLAPPVAIQAAPANKTAPAAPPAAPPRAAAVAAPAPPAADTTVVFSGRKLEEIEAKDNTANTTNADSKEVVVTGSRIVNRAATPASGIDVSYRNNQDSWLSTIRDLTNELRTLDSQNVQRSAHAREVADRLRDERALFAQKYPAVNIDATLKAP